MGKTGGSINHERPRIRLVGTEGPRGAAGGSIEAKPPLRVGPFRKDTEGPA